MEHPLAADPAISQANRARTERDPILVYAPVNRPGAQWEAVARYRRIFLFFILLTAALLRLYRVDQPLIDAFSWRQASTAMMADNFYRTDPNIFYPEVSWTGPGPNYQGREFQTFSYIVSLLYRAFGQHEAFGRAVSAAFGVLGVFSMYALCRRVWDDAHGLAAALMLAIMPGAIFIDRSFLPDPAMLGLTLTALWLFVRALQIGGARPMVLAAFMMSLAFLTKLPGASALPAIIYLICKHVGAAPRGVRKRRALWLTLTLVLILIPVAIYYRWAVHLGNSYPPYHIAGSANWVWKHGVMKWWTEESYFIPSTLQNIVGWLWTAPVIGLVMIGLVVPPPRSKGKLPIVEESTGDPAKDAAARAQAPKVVDVRFFFHFWVIGVVVLYFLGARELSENVWNFHVFNGVAAAFAGHALAMVASLPSDFALTRKDRRTDIAVPVAFFRRIPRGTWRIALFVIVTIGYGEYRLVQFYDSRHALNSYLLGAYLRKVSQPGDLVATVADDVGDPIAIYYSGRRGWVFPQANYEKWKPWNLFPPNPMVSVEMFEELRKNGAKWLGIVTTARDDGKGNFWSNQAYVIAHINRTCQFVTKNQSYVVYRILTPEELAARELAVKQRLAATRPTTQAGATTTPTTAATTTSSTTTPSTSPAATPRP